MNLYQAFGGNPVNFVDPWGEQTYTGGAKYPRKQAIVINVVRKKLISVLEQKIEKMEKERKLEEDKYYRLKRADGLLYPKIKKRMDKIKDRSNELKDYINQYKDFVKALKNTPIILAIPNEETRKRNIAGQVNYWGEVKLRWLDPSGKTNFMHQSPPKGAKDATVIVINIETINKFIKNQNNKYLGFLFNILMHEAIHVALGHLKKRAPYWFWGKKEVETIKANIKILKLLESIVGKKAVKEAIKHELQYGKKKMKDAYKVINPSSDLKKSIEEWESLVKKHADVFK